MGDLVDPVHLQALLHQRITLPLLRPTGRAPDLSERCVPGPLEHDPNERKRLLSFSPTTPQRNRNELGETTVNKTWRKHLPQQGKSTT